MTPQTILGFIPLLVGLFSGQPVAMQQTVTRLVVQQEVILRVPVEPHAVEPQVKPQEECKKTGQETINTCGICP